MKTNLDCLPCLLRQTLQTIRLCTASEAVHERAVKAVASLIAGIDLDKTPPAIAASVYGEIERISGVADPYKAKKKESNQIALSVIDDLRNKLSTLDDRKAFELAIRYAIAGNIIDYGAFHTFDIFDKLKKCCDAEFVVDHREELYARVNQLTYGTKVLYLADNCGEIVFDTLLVEYLHKKGAEITVATKGGAIINDALEEDAFLAGLDTYATIINNGTRCPGTVLDLASEQFLQSYYGADLIISKGQGNFESLSEEKEEIFFLLTIKCAAAARHMRELSGSEHMDLTGKGELALYHSPATQ